MVPPGATQESFSHQFLPVDAQLDQEPQNLLEENGEGHRLSAVNGQYD